LLLALMPDGANVASSIQAFVPIKGCYRYE
jgi:hypothetical protein